MADARVPIIIHVDERWSIITSIEDEDFDGIFDQVICEKLVREWEEKEAQAKVQS